MEHLVVPALADFEDRWTLSHVVRHDGLLYLSGVTGTTADGAVASDPAEQFRQAFEHLREHLATAGADVADIVEMTTYHVGLRRHLEEFMAVKARYVVKPYPAWSAIGVAELITEGALVELRVIARDPRAS